MLEERVHRTVLSTGILSGSKGGMVVSHQFHLGLTKPDDERCVDILRISFGLASVPTLPTHPALVFGKPTTPKVKLPSVSVDWEGSDSSIDSIHSSPHSSIGDPDWPPSPGYEVMTTNSIIHVHTLSIHQSLWSAETWKSAFTD